MTRILKPSNRPLIALTPMLVIAIIGVFRWGFNIEFLGAILALCFFLAAVIRGMQISISDKKITFRRYFLFSKSVHLSEIDHSNVQYLDHPISLSIYKTHDKGPTLTIPLKSFHKDDIQWLIKNQALKVNIYGGFTKRKMSV